MRRQKLVCRLAAALVALASCGGRSSLLVPVRDGATGDRVRTSDSVPDAVLDARCPRERPQIGDRCAVPTLACHYERCLVEGKSDLSFVCVVDTGSAEGSFGLQDRWDCAPNPSSCPLAPPLDGSPCDLPGAICRWAPGSKAHCWETDRRWHVWRP